MGIIPTFTWGKTLPCILRIKSLHLSMGLGIEPDKRDQLAGRFNLAEEIPQEHSADSSILHIADVALVICLPAVAIGLKT